MKRSFYSYAIFFGVLFVIIAFIQTVVYWNLGTQVYSLDSFMAWYTLVAILSTVGAIIISKYFHYKEFKLALWAGIISVIFQLLQFGVVAAMRSGVMSIGNYYMVIYLMTLSTSLLYGSALIFSRAGRRPWLRAAGILIFVSAVVLICAVVWHMNSTALDKNLTIEIFHQWSSLAGCLIPVFYILNFKREQQDLSSESNISAKEKEPVSEKYAVYFGAICVLAILVLGVKLATEATSKLSWAKQLAVKAKEWETIFESRSFSHNAQTLRYQLLKPLDYDPEKKYPLVVCLPYGGGVEGCPPAQALLSSSNRVKYPAFLYVPFCPEGSGWGGIPNYPTMDTLVFESILSLEKELPGIDANRRYVTGVSRGGYGSWHFISVNPGMFAAAVPVCGGGNPKLAAGIYSVDVWAFHGEDDRNVPVNGSRDMIEAIKQAGGNPKYTEFPDEGHNIWDQVNSTPGLLDWLFAQTRQ
ncbi:MAG: hypothetical protein WKF87_08765 [Chryseolinea sp.]